MTTTKHTHHKRPLLERIARTDIKYVKSGVRWVRRKVTG